MIIKVKITKDQRKLMDLGYKYHTSNGITFSFFPLWLKHDLNTKEDCFVENIDVPEEIRFPVLTDFLYGSKLPLDNFKKELENEMETLNN